ncbi:MAG: hypothetical protein M3R67_08370, partial [Acidobacteriota bacterium]|nr:hypothetical protein [Acidobacteriota bacterium]
PKHAQIPPKRTDRNSFAIQTQHGFEKRFMRAPDMDSSVFDIQHVWQMQRISYPQITQIAQISRRDNRQPCKSQFEMGLNAVVALLIVR